MLGPDQIRRYARHVLLPDVGGVGQARLLAARVAVPTDDPAAVAAAIYLAAAGVGALTLAPGPVLDGPAITAGVAFTADDVGRPAAPALADRIAALNPDCRAAPADDLDAAPGAPTAALAIAPLALPPLPGSELADALVRGGAAACALLHRLATSR